MKKELWLLVALIAQIMPLHAVAEVPLRSPKELRDGATHIVVGRVQKVYASTSRDKDWETTDYVAEIAVEKVEKGGALKPGELVFARYWHVSWLGPDPPPPHAGGHHSVAKGDHVRAFLVQNKQDNGLDAILPNGFEKKPKPGR